MTNHTQVAVINDPGTNENLRLDFIHMKKSMLILRAINHKLRQQILKMIDESGKMTVTELYVKLRLEQSVASQHLAILREKGVLLTRKDANRVFYRVGDQRTLQLVGMMREVFCGVEE